MPYLQINPHYFIDNLRVIKSIIGEDEGHKIAIVLKDNAYGHGLVELAKISSEAGITSCFVKNIQEAIEVAKWFEHISILYPQSLESETLLKSCIQRENIYFCVANIESLDLYPPKSKIELKINSGMNRNGIQINKLQEALKKSLENKLEIVGVFSHNGFGDNIGSEFYVQNDSNLHIKKEVLQFCKANSLKKPRFHFLSSSGALRAAKYNVSLPIELQDDLYRIGIALYGYLCQDSMLYEVQLKPIASLWAKKISTQLLKKGSRIGYGGISKVDEDMLVSTYDIGYGDGLFRVREGMELFTKEGLKIFPRASMDCISIQGDCEEVCIFDDVRPWAEAFGTIPYEILSHLHSYIPKKILQ